MSMLAQPRQKQRYNLLPRGKALYEDENNFGTRMLQKMGWSKGKGLGSKEDGNKDFVRITYKNDNNGLGFKDCDDGWTQHETDFEGLLKSLSNSAENSDGEDNNTISPTLGFAFKKENNEKNKKEKETTKSIKESLEEKSKNSRVRVHYKKFTRGKDLSQYSEKDLANIFGRKTLNRDETNKIVEVVTKCEKDIKGNLNVGHSHGVTTLSTGISINDYFKNKMALFKAKNQNGSISTENFENVEVKLNNVQEGANGSLEFTKKINKKSKRQKKGNDYDVVIADNSQSAYVPETLRSKDLNDIEISNFEYKDEVIDSLYLKDKSKKRMKGIESNIKTIDNSQSLENAPKMLKNEDSNHIESSNIAPQDEAIESNNIKRDVAAVILNDTIDTKKKSKKRKKGNEIDIITVGYSQSPDDVLIDQNDTMDAKKKYKKRKGGNGNDIDSSQLSDVPKQLGNGGFNDIGISNCEGKSKAIESNTRNCDVAHIELNGSLDKRKKSKKRKNENATSNNEKLRKTNEVNNENVNDAVYVEILNDDEQNIKDINKLEIAECNVGYTEKKKSKRKKRALEENEQTLKKLLDTVQKSTTGQNEEKVDEKIPIQTDQKNKRKNKIREDYEDKNTINENNSQDYIQTQTVDVPRKKKSKMGMSKVGDNIKEINFEEDKSDSNDNVEGRSTKNKVDTKKMENEITVNQTDEQEELNEKLKKSKKSKKEKNRQNTETQAQEDMECSPTTTEKQLLEENIDINNSENTEKDQTVETHSKKSKKKLVSNDKSNNLDPVQENGISDQPLVLTKKDTSYDDVSGKPIYKINCFCAEKFRHTDIKGFTGSNFGEIIGYGLSKNTSVQVVYNAKDEDNIADMWYYAIDKYNRLNEEGKEVKKKFNLKKYKKKSLFNFK